MYKWFEWCIRDLRSVSGRGNARGYPCTKGYNSSAPPVTVRRTSEIVLGTPLGTFRDHSGRFGVRGEGCTADAPGSSTKSSRISGDSLRAFPIARQPALPLQYFFSQRVFCLFFFFLVTIHLINSSVLRAGKQWLTQVFCRVTAIGNTAIKAV